MNRRIFLKGAGGAALAAPFLTSVAERAAKAQSTELDIPKRLCIFFTHNGCNTNKWFPAIENGALTAGDLSPTLQPLAPFVDKLLIARGYRSMNGYGENQTIDPHDQAMGSKLTCALIEDNQQRFATARSLDHIIADQINPNGAAPLVVGAGAGASSIKELCSFSAPVTPTPANVNPQSVYNQLTGLFSSGGGVVETEGDYQVSLGNSVIDVVRDDLESYQRLDMSQRDQQRVQDWLDLLRDTEKQVVPSADCTVDIATQLGVTDATVSAASPGNGLNGNAQSFTEGGDMMHNLIALSMICDSNRSIIMHYAGYVQFGWDGINHDADHHGISHRNGSFQVGGTCLNGVMDMIAEIDNWYAGKYARLVGLLDSVVEGDGTMLDNSACMWLPELSDGNAHNLNNLPIAIAGSCGGYLKTGQAVNVWGSDIGPGNSEGNCTDGNNDNSNTQSTGTGGFGNSAAAMPINKLYCTLMNALGCTQDGGEVTHFGEFDSGNTASGITNPGENTELKANA